ncbi:hypothetical protein [Nocardia thraciensis]
MSIWYVLSSIVATLAACGCAVIAVGCVWPTEEPRRSLPATRPPGARRPLRPIEWPQAWTCDMPTRPLTLADAHRALQLHRDHGCARKRAAFTTLVAFGHINPESTRRQHSASDRHAS